MSFREMKHANQQLSDEEAIAILQRGKSGVLALHGDNGYPYAVPISYFTTKAKLSCTARPQATNTNCLRATTTFPSAWWISTTSCRRNSPLISAAPSCSARCAPLPTPPKNRPRSKPWGTNTPPAKTASCPISANILIM